MNTENHQENAATPNATALSGLEKCPLHRRTPFGMRNVSQTQLSIARHYGGIKYQGDDYTYFPASDELVRNDALRWRKSEGKDSPPIG